jgi:hypothetical protein
VLDSIDYNETVYVNAQMDYKHDYYGGVYVQHLSQLPGDHGVVYKQIMSDGVLNLYDTLTHTISIEVKDAYFNTSQLNFAVQYIDSLSVLLPDTNAGIKLSPNQFNVINKPNFEIVMPENCLYDDVPLDYFWEESFSAYDLSGKHHFNNGSLPVHEDFPVRIKPNKPIPEEWKNKLVIEKSDKGKQIKKAEWDKDWLTASFGGFGIFQVMADVVPPVINELGYGDTVDLSKSSRIVFTPLDYSGIKKFRAELDGQWLRFTNDKGRNWIYKFDEKCPYGIHLLTVYVEDLVGNTTTKSWWFERNEYVPPPPKKKVVQKTSSKPKPVVSAKKKK